MESNGVEQAGPRSPSCRAREPPASVTRRVRRGRCQCTPRQPARRAHARERLRDVVMQYDRARRPLGSGDATVAQEHFASNLLRGRHWDWLEDGTRRRAAGCPRLRTGELHDLALIVFGLALRRQGWRIIPRARHARRTLADTAKQLYRPRRRGRQLISRLKPREEALSRFAKTTRIAIGGAGATAGPPSAQVRSSWWAIP